MAVEDDRDGQEKWHSAYLTCLSCGVKRGLDSKLFVALVENGFTDSPLLTKNWVTAPYGNCLDLLQSGSLSALISSINHSSSPLVVSVLTIGLRLLPPWRSQKEVVQQLVSCGWLACMERNGIDHVLRQYPRTHTELETMELRRVFEDFLWLFCDRHPTVAVHSTILARYCRERERLQSSSSEWPVSVDEEPLEPFVRLPPDWTIGFPSDPVQLEPVQPDVTFEPEIDTRTYDEASPSNPFPERARPEMPEEEGNAGRDLSVPLPRGWTMTFSEEVRRWYFVDYNTGRTTWADPRKHGLEGEILLGGRGDLSETRSTTSEGLTRSWVQRIASNAAASEYAIVETSEDPGPPGFSEREPRGNSDRSAALQVETDTESWSAGRPDESSENDVRDGEGETEGGRDAGRREEDPRVHHPLL